MAIFLASAAFAWMISRSVCEIKNTWWMKPFAFLLGLVLPYVLFGLGLFVIEKVFGELQYIDVVGLIAASFPAFLFGSIVGIWTKTNPKR